MSGLTEAGRGRIAIRDLSIRLGGSAAARGSVEALHKLTLDVEPGQLVCVLGPSGCGKSTLLGALAGHVRPSSGAIEVDGQPVSGPDPERGLVFQHHTLFPWQRVIDNVAFSLKMKGVPKAARRAEARALLRLIGLDGFEECYPSQLSGGMLQRVEIARVLVARPRVLLMDEPFGSLDAQTRFMMQELLLEVWSRIRTTVVFITHDVDEALFLGDRILVMSARPGRVVEDLRIDFPRPREVGLTASPEFIALKRRCLDLLRQDRAAPAAGALPPDAALWFAPLSAPGVR